MHVELCMSSVLSLSHTSTIIMLIGTYRLLLAGQLRLLTSHFYPHIATQPNLTWAALLTTGAVNPAGTDTTSNYGFSCCPWLRASVVWLASPLPIYI
jgi:hypothetical protein